MRARRLQENVHVPFADRLVLAPQSVVNDSLVSSTLAQPPQTMCCHFYYYYRNCY